MWMTERAYAGHDANVMLDGEEATLHITDQSVMFEKDGKVSGFERSAIRLIKPDGNGMVIAYAVGSEVKSVRVEPITAVVSLLTSESRSSSQASTTASSLDDVFERLYTAARKDLEERLAKVQEEPENKSLRLTSDERQKYISIRNQMIRLADAKHRFNPDGDDALPALWDLEQQPYELQLTVVKIHHIHFLLGLVSPKAETEDIGYFSYHVWPEDWPRILEHFNLRNTSYITEQFTRYVNYLKSHWTHQPSSRRPVVVST